MTSTSYQEAVDWLFTRLPMFSRIGVAALKKDLTNTVALCSFLGNPENKFRCIHIAGTNGKGSTSHMLAAIFQTAGFKTGLYTSPHLHDFRERIKINGRMIGEDDVASFVERIRPIAESVDPSFFEITVAMAFNYFANEQVDIAIIETGLGGRLDSTNIVTPELSVITNIGRDHMNILGDTIAQIAEEKAGIIKPNIPVVIGEKGEQSQEVFLQHATQKNSPLSFADDRWMVSDWEVHGHAMHISVEERSTSERRSYEIDIPAYYQTKNLITVLQAIHEMRNVGWKIDEQHVHKGLKSFKKITGLHGRWENISSSPKAFLDVAHNIEGFRQLISQVELTDHQSLHMVIGMVKDKEIDDVLSVLPTHAKYYFTRAAIPRALDENTLAQKARSRGLHGEAFPNVNVAYEAALQHATKNDLIIICGSVFVVAELQR
jgi:dihydrofolate synthase / folylpolyglutamate synthase